MVSFLLIALAGTYAMASNVRCLDLAVVNELVKKKKIEIVKKEMYSLEAHKWTLRRKNGDTLEGLYLWQDKVFCSDKRK